MIGIEPLEHAPHLVRNQPSLPVRCDICLVSLGCQLEPAEGTASMIITPNVHSLRIEFKVTIEPGRAVDRFVNIFVLFGTRTWIIDTGVAGSETALFDALRESNRALDSVAGIVLSHGHADHIGAAKALCAATGAPVYAHPAERNWIEDIDTQAKERPIPGFHQLVGGSVRIDHELMANPLVARTFMGHYALRDRERLH
jgi:glyoxylase-like metal-dependent hydrolase (beta-lactamase superfamily II)